MSWQPFRRKSRRGLQMLQFRAPWRCNGSSADFVDRRVEYAFNAREAFWTHMEGEVNKHLFSTHGPRHGRERVSEFIDSDGVLKTPGCCHAQSFRSLCLSSIKRRCLLGQGSARTSIWQTILVLVNSNMHGSLDAPFTNSKFKTALLALHKSKCPRSDGLTPSFLISLWVNIGDDVMAALQAMWDSSMMLDALSEGLIHLIPKGGCRNLTFLWRPITLLGTCYKTLAKAVSFRLQPFLPDLIHNT